MNPAETFFPGLWGGDGNDTLTGGPGADKFVMSHGNDIVTDFRVDEGDTISFLGVKVHSLFTNTILMSPLRGSTMAKCRLKVPQD